MCGLSLRLRREVSRIRQMMTAYEVQAKLQSSRPPLLIQVLPVEIYGAIRLPRAKCACVYEMSFLDQVNAFAPDQSTPIVVYGAGEGSLDAVTAAGKLQAAGYTNVELFGGGLAEWKDSGFPLEGTSKLPEPAVPDGHYNVDVAGSIVRWTGRNLFNHHHGTVQLLDGQMTLSQGQLETARFTVNMNSVVCEDLADASLNATLVAHLRSDDFFDVDNHPTATFVATGVEPIVAASPGTPNFRLSGNFTLRGITRPLHFPVLIAASDDGARITGQGVLELDRTAFGCQYGSGKLFRFLGKHLVNDHVQLHVKLHADRSA